MLDARARKTGATLKKQHLTHNVGTLFRVQAGPVETSRGWYRYRTAASAATMLAMTLRPLVRHVSWLRRQWLYLDACKGSVSIIEVDQKPAVRRVELYERVQS